MEKGPLSEKGGAPSSSSALGSTCCVFWMREIFMMMVVNLFQEPGDSKRHIYFLGLVEGKDALRGFWR